MMLMLFCDSCPLGVKVVACPLGTKWWPAHLAQSGGNPAAAVTTLFGGDFRTCNTILGLLWFMRMGLRRFSVSYFGSVGGLFYRCFPAWNQYYFVGIVFFAMLRQPEKGQP